jgi:hypothetical protein
MNLPPEADRKGATSLTTVNHIKRHSQFAVQQVGRIAKG